MFVITAMYRGKEFEDIENFFKRLEAAIVETMDGSSQKLSREMMRTMERTYNKIEKEHSRRWNGRVVNPSLRLQKRSGGGLQSIWDSIKVMDALRIEEVRGQISTSKMTVHETGATIRAKRAQFLTIPLPAAMDQRGVPLRERARDWDNTFVARSRRGNLLIFRREPGINRITPLYILKPEVKIMPRLNMERTITNDALPYFERKTLEIISKELDSMEL